MQGDFTETSVRQALKDMILTQSKNGPQDSLVDVVLSDMMGTFCTDSANMSGNTVRDSQASLDLCVSAFVRSVLTQEFCQAMLRPTPEATTRLTRATPPNELPSAFICKYFMSAEAEEFRREVLAKHFLTVRSEKMSASRTASREQYWVCLGYRA